MTKQEILKEIEESLNYCTDDSDYIIKFSKERVKSKLITKKKFILAEDKSDKNLKFSTDDLNKALKIFAEKQAENIENQRKNLPYYPQQYPWPYFIPNNPMQTPWYWDKVICSGTDQAISISGDSLLSKVISDSDADTGFVKGYNYP